MHYLNTVSLNEALECLLTHTTLPRRLEEASLLDALGKVAGETLLAQEDVPAFLRSTVDGFAVCARGTQGASPQGPVPLLLLGECTMGERNPWSIHELQTVAVPTGGMLPKGADAMVMMEDARRLGPHVLVERPARIHEHLIFPGDDLRCGAPVVEQGTVLTGEDLAALASVGYAQIPCIAPLRVALLSTGDELIEPGEALPLGCVRDINRILLAARLPKSCTVETYSRLLPDDPEAQKLALWEAQQAADLILVTAGSSAGARDFTRRMMEEAGAEILFHGLRLKPGKPTLAARLGEVPVLGLPGHPLSALMAFELLGIPYIEQSLGIQSVRRCVPARLRENVASSPGRLTCLFVTLSKGEEGLWATPIPQQSALLSQWRKASGYVLLPEACEGLDEGAKIEVVLR
ncbi:Molybdopterin biosynthesis protein MoeA [Clostridiaceae bacterium JG1575]|nr:Molybdopterin biosynthesis protein MoeA [Clostridiaceae bacterium JG1575]